MADFSVADVIADARVELGDTFEGSYAYATGDLARYVGEGIVTLRGMRPSVAYDRTTGKLLNDDDKWAALGEGDTAFYVPLEPRYRRTLTAFAVFKCLSRDETDKGNAARADDAYKRFVESAAL